MPRLDKHRAISRERTGHPYAELHKWMDEHYTELGEEHRIHRHVLRSDDLEYVRKRFGGDKAVVEWLFHSAIDSLETAYKISKRVYGDLTYNFIMIGFGKGGYLHVAFRTLDDRSLQDLDTIFSKGGAWFK